MSESITKQDVTVTYKIDDTEIKLTPKIVQDYIVSGSAAITMPEFKMFTELCKVRKLNPFLKEAYLIKFGTQPAQMVVGKDAILKRAISNKAFDGREQGIIVKCIDGKIEERKGTFKLKDEELVGGWAKVYRKDWSHPVYITVSFDEVAQRKNDGALNSNWNTKGATMVEKVALVRGLREAFVEDLGGMIDEDEAWDNKQEVRASTKQESIPQKDLFGDDVIECETVTEVDINDV
jgi:phage recombination protein Bet